MANTWARRTPWGPRAQPVSHVAYGYATQVCILDDEGKIRQMVAAHDVGKGRESPCPSRGRSRAAW